MKILINKLTKDSDLKKGLQVCYKDTFGEFNQIGKIERRYFDGINLYIVNGASYSANELKLIAQETKTTIHSNGSKWGGQAPDSIEKLIERLSIYTIEQRFFCKFKERFNSTKKHVLFPISKVDGNYWFFGNFEEISGVFRIETNCPETITKLRTAIMNNAGWKANISRCKRLEA